MIVRESGIIVGGQPRSGTTLVAALLGGQRGVSMFPGEIIPVYDLRYTRLARSKGAKEVFIYQNCSFHLGTELGQEAAAVIFRQPPKDHVDAFIGLLDWWRDRKRGEKWAFKAPNAEFFCNALMQKTFAHFVYVVRDPRDVFASLRSRRFLRASSATGAAAVWKRSVNSYFDLREKFPDRVHIIRYEDLIEDPEKQFKRVDPDFSVDPESPEFSGFLGKRSNNSAFKTDDKQRSAKIYSSGIGRYMDLLSEKEKAIFDCLCADEMGELGYLACGEDGVQKQLSPGVRLGVSIWQRYYGASEMMALMGILRIKNTGVKSLRKFIGL